MLYQTLRLYPMLLQQSCFLDTGIKAPHRAIFYVFQNNSNS